MTNAEKFEKVFGFEPNWSGCITSKCSNCPLSETTVIGHCKSEDLWSSDFTENKE